MGLIDPKKFALWVDKQVTDKCGYLMGAVGQYTKDLTTGSWLVQQYKDNAAQYNKAKYWLKNAPRVFDCQGLADCFISEQTKVKTNVYARNNYSTWCSVKGEGMIPPNRRTPGAAVFMHSKSAGHITHVGFLIRPVSAADPNGDWIVGEARGVLYGCVHTRLLDRGWNRWGWMDKYFDYGPELGEDDPASELGDRTLRRGMSGDDVKQLQECLLILGYSLGKYGADGDFGEATEKAVTQFKADNGLKQDGVAGVKCIELLKELTKDDPDKEPDKIPDEPAPEPKPNVELTVTGGSVYLWSGYPGYGGEKDVVVHKGDKLLRLIEGDYVPVIHKGTVKWINKKYID